jgi:hypothetical protein
MDDPRRKDLEGYLRQLELAGKDALHQIITSPLIAALFFIFK